MDRFLQVSIPICSVALIGMYFYRKQRKPYLPPEKTWALCPAVHGAMPCHYDSIYGLTEECTWCGFTAKDAETIWKGPLPCENEEEINARQCEILRAKAAEAASGYDTVARMLQMERVIAFRDACRVLLKTTSDHDTFEHLKKDPELLAEFDKALRNKKAKKSWLV